VVDSPALALEQDMQSPISAADPYRGEVAEPLLQDRLIARPGQSHLMGAFLPPPDSRPERRRPSASPLRSPADVAASLVGWALSRQWETDAASALLSGAKWGARVARHQNKMRLP
jgi:hypothetical protein